MGKEDKQPLTTQWDPELQDWCMPLNLRPADPSMPRKVAKFVDKEQKAIELEQIDKIKEILINSPVFKKLSERIDYNHNATLTGGLQAYLDGYISGQALLVITFSGIVGSVILPYIRGIQFPPFQGNAEDTANYYEGVKDTLELILASSLVASVFGLAVSVVNKKHEHDSKLEAEEYKFIEDVINRLGKIDNEIKLKKRVIEKVAIFLVFNHEEANLEIDFNVRPQVTAQSGVRAQLANVASTIKSSMSYAADTAGRFVRRNHALPEKNVGAPKTLKDWLLFTLDNMDDLNVYTDLDKTLYGTLADARIAGIVLDLLKIAFHEKYLEDPTLAEDIDLSVNNIYDLFQIVDKFSANETSKPTPAEFILTTFINILRDEQKLSIIKSLLKCLDIADSKQETGHRIDPILYTSFLKELNIQLSKKSPEMISKIYNRFEKLTKDELQLFINSAAALLPKSDTLQLPINAMLSVLESDNLYKKFSKQRSFDFILKPLLTSNKYGGFFEVVKPSRGEKNQASQTRETKVTVPSVQTRKRQK